MARLILLASLFALGYALFYLARCSQFPYTDCRRCKGTGKRRSLLGGNAYRQCNACAGTARRVRLGRRVFEYFRSEYRRGTLPGDPRPAVRDQAHRRGQR